MKHKGIWLHMAEDEPATERVHWFATMFHHMVDDYTCYPLTACGLYTRRNVHTHAGDCWDEVMYPFRVDSDRQDDEGTKCAECLYALRSNE